MEQANKDIREYAKNTGVKFWQIAKVYGIHEGNFSRKLRQELPDAEKSKIMAIIEELAMKKGA